MNMIDVDKTTFEEESIKSRRLMYLLTSMEMDVFLVRH